MIKTIISVKIEELDKQVNEFMSARKQNLPVRTEVFVIEGGGSATVMHKATIFFDENFLQSKTGLKVDMSHEIPEITKPKDASKKEGMGALWIQKNGEVTGKFDGEDYGLPMDIIDRLDDGERVIVKINGKLSVIMANKYKKTENHPDYVILPKK